MVLRSFRFVPVREASRRSVIAIPLVAIALGVATGKATSQELPPTQPGPTLTTGDVPSVDPTSQPTPQPTLTSGAPGKALDDSYTPPGVTPTASFQQSLPPESKIITLEPQYISAGEFSRVLEKLLLRDDVHFVPDERTNRLLIVVSPSTEEEMVRLDKRLHEIKELVDVEATRPAESDQNIQNVASWQKLVHDLQTRENDLLRQLEAVSKANPQQRNANQMEELKRMEFDVQLARIRRMRSQLDLMEAQLYENAGVQRPSPELPVSSVPYATPPVPPVAPSVPSANPLDSGQAPSPPVAPVPPTLASPPTPAAPPAPALASAPTVASAPALAPADIAPTAPAASDHGSQLRDGRFVPAWGLAGELLRLRESLPNMDLTPVYNEMLQRLHVQHEGLVTQEKAMNEVREAVVNQAKAGTATAVDVARIEAQIVPLRSSVRELEVQIKSLKELREKILPQEAADELPQVQR